MSQQEVYVSVDIETDGPLPGPNSMLSFGAAAFVLDQVEPIGTCTYNLELLPEAQGDPDTMTWWSKPGNAKAWAACREDTTSPEFAMTEFVKWVDTLPGTPVFVGYPAGFDFLFLYVYMLRFVGRSPFSFSALDIKSYAAAVLKTPYRKTTKRNFPKRWFKGLPPHTHVALDDAIEQGMLFMNILRENLEHVAG